MSATTANPRPALTTEEIVVYATPTRSGTQLRFDCPCGRVHLHGRAEPGSGTTPYRESHCRDPRSPLFDTVYRLVEVAPKDPPLTQSTCGRRSISRLGRP